MEVTHSKQSGGNHYLDFEKSLNNIGSLVKKAREEKNLTIESLAENLKINKSYISAIESGNCKLLPENIYVKAMIRRIAEKLDLELDLNSFFNQEPENKKDDLSRSEEIKPKRINKSFFLISLFALATFFLGAFTVKVGLQWLLLKSEPAEITNQSSR